MGLPGLQTARDHYTALASGDPNTIFKEVAPAAEMIKANATATKRSIDESAPRGGTRDLAKQEVDIGAAGQVGNLESKSYTSSFPALASLASGSLGLSVNEIANAISGFSGASATAGQVGNQEAQGKAAQLGFFGALAGAGAEGASAACWIAEVLFGIDSERTRRVRFYLNQVFGWRWWGRPVMALYRCHGKAVAKVVAGNVFLRALFYPVFALADYHARAWESMVAGEFSREGC